MPFNHTVQSLTMLTILIVLLFIFQYLFYHVATATVQHIAHYFYEKSDLGT